MKTFAYNSILCSILLLIDIVQINVSAKEVFYLGDANVDGKVDAADIVEIVNFILGKQSDLLDTDLADINDDGHISIADIVCITNVIMGKAKVRERSIDTLHIIYQDDKVLISDDYNHSRFHMTVNRTADLKIVYKGKYPFVCIAEGVCHDGCLIVDADTTSTFILNNLQLSSSNNAAISFLKKQMVNIELPDGSSSILCDATTRGTDDESVNGCLYSKGALAFTGKGTLSVTGNYRHGIVSSKNINVEECHLMINNVVKNGIHCDNFTLKDGQIDLHLQNDASKGIKTKEELVIQSGVIEGEAIGNIINEDGDLSYSSLLKSDGTMTISGGTLTLKQYGDGGRCISVDNDLTMTAGTMNLECHGDGGQYTNADNELDYYTPKCITVDGCARIERGTLNLLATGSGGKGIVSSDTLFIGRKNDGLLSEDSLHVNVETRGWCLEDNIHEDYRRGCPKAIKGDGDIYLYSGTLRIKTHGQGGEGIESKGSLRAYHCTAVADCYDDGINTGQRFTCYDSHIYCLSHHNDGIDSNGKCTVMGGIVATISEDLMNESFDTEGETLYIYGGHVIGIGNNEVHVAKQSYIPYYSTKLTTGNWGRRFGDGIVISSDNYLTLSKDGEAIVSLYHKYANDDVFVLVASKLMEKGQQYQLSDGEKPTNSTPVLSGNVLIGGNINYESLFNFISE